jgi:anti-anti-sigma regulatory factor
MTNQDSSFFILSWADDIAILKLIDRPHYKMSDIEVLEAFRHDLIGFLDRVRPVKILVDFSDLWRIGRLALGGAAVKGVLISAKRRSRRTDCRWKFCGMSDPVRQCYELSRLDAIFPMYDSQEEALAAFQDKS